MNHTNLARHLAEFEAVIESLDLRQEPANQRLAEPQPNPEVQSHSIRPRRLTRGIIARDQGFRPFRVC